MKSKLKGRIKDSRRAESGQLLFEAMIALSVLMMGLLGILILFNQALGLNRVVSDNYTGAYLAAEGIELAKNLIDTNIIQKKPWNDSIDPGSYEIDYRTQESANLKSPESRAGSEPRPLRLHSFTRLYSYQPSADAFVTPFTRVIEISWPSANEIKVNSIVRWTTRGRGRFEANVEDHFFNWRP